RKLRSIQQNVSKILLITSSGWQPSLVRYNHETCDSGGL
ncbi:hypothetical protein DNTS_018557, partial [Danionella cerebrum]